MLGGFDCGDVAAQALQSRAEVRSRFAEDPPVLPVRGSLILIALGLHVVVHPLIDVRKAIARGVSVYQGDLESALEDYPDGAFDYVILSQTLQQTQHPLKVLRGMLRIGRRAIVAFPNFAHWRVRMSHLSSGRSPRTDLFPYEWYDSPNIHFLTVLDFELLAQKEGWKIERRVFLSGHHRVTMFPNLAAEVAVFLFSAS